MADLDFGSGLAADPPLWVCAGGQSATDPVAHPLVVSALGAQSANLVAGNRASGEHQGCLSCVHGPGTVGGGVPEATAAAESSLTIC